MINNIKTDKPIKMKKEELSLVRQKVVSYMEEIASTPWVPEESFILYNPGKNGCTRMFCVYIAGETYYGMPYININMSQPETFEKMKNGSYKPFKGTDEELRKITCLQDLLDIGGETLDTAIENAFTFPGNDCILAVLLAWNTLLENTPEVQNMQVCLNMIPGQNNGVLAVGDYDYSNKFDFNSDDINLHNGWQKMAKAYGELQPGDAIAHIQCTKGNARHVRMVYDYPHIEYTTDENGEEIIDLEKSYLICLDQAGGAAVRFIVGENKTTCHVKEHYFKDILKQGALPISIKEVLTGVVTEEKTTLSDFEIKVENGEIKLGGLIESNRQMITVRAEISDESTVRECYADFVLKPGGTVPNYHRADYNLTEMNLSSLTLEKGKEYKFSLYACIAGNNGKESLLVKDNIIKA